MRLLLPVIPALVLSGAVTQPALAANPGPDFTTLKAPSSVTAGEVFRVKCKLRSAWAGGEVRIKERTTPVAAKREVGPNGQCTMRLILNAVGERKIRLVVVQDLGAERSRWVPITVLPR